MPLCCEQLFLLNWETFVNYARPNFHFSPPTWCHIDRKKKDEGRRIYFNVMFPELYLQLCEHNEDACHKNNL